MFDEIFFIACFAGGAGNQFSAGNIEVADERQRTVPDVFKLTPFYFVWTHRQAWMFAFQSLYTCHFIQTFRALPLFCSFKRLFVNRIDVGYFFVKAFFVGGCQPVAAQVGFDISLFLKAWLHGVVKFQ